MRLSQGAVHWAEAGGKRRPVLIVSRSDVLARVSRVVVAPVTRKVRNMPTEIALGPDEGLEAACAASFDNLQLIPRAGLGERLGRLPHPRRQICRALAALADC